VKYRVFARSSRLDLNSQDSLRSLRGYRVGRVIGNFQGIQSLGGRLEAGSLHMSELVSEDISDGGFVVHVVREVRHDMC